MGVTLRSRVAVSAAGVNNHLCAAISVGNFRLVFRDPRRWKDWVIPLPNWRATPLPFVFLSLFARYSLATKWLKFGCWRCPTSQVNYYVTRWSFWLGFSKHHWLPMWHISGSDAVLVSRSLSPTALLLSVCLVNRTDSISCGVWCQAVETAAKARQQDAGQRTQKQTYCGKVSIAKWEGRGG